MSDQTSRVKPLFDLILIFFTCFELAKVNPLLSQLHLETVIHVFVTSPMDYCNTIYFGVSQSSISSWSKMLRLAS